MRIFDQVGLPEGQRPLRIAIIGTCRVLNPFEDLATAGKLERVWANYPAATYSLGEAIQIVQYTRQERELSQSLLPFIFDEPEKLPPRGPAQRELLDSCDVFVVEIPELRQFRHLETYFQVNVFFRNFLGKYQSAVGPWYRVLSEARPISTELADLTLASLQHLDEAERSVVESVLRHTQLEITDLNAAKERIPLLKFNSTAQWLLVPHVVVPGIDGTLMQGRVQIREILREASVTCGMDFFDPSDVVARYGREVALNKQGTDLHHYNPEFQWRIADAIIERMTHAF